MRNRLVVVFQIAGLALTGWLLWGARLWAHGSRISLFDVLARSAAYALVACAAGAAIMIAIFVLGVREWESEALFRAALRTSRSAIWFAPSIILFTALSPAAIAAAGLLVVSATRLLYHEWRRFSTAAEEPEPVSGPFAAFQLPQPHFWREAAPALAVSFSTQCAGAAWLLRLPLLAGMGFALTVALATGVWLSRQAPYQKPPESLPRAFLGVLLTLVLAVGLTLGGMLPGMLRGDGSGFGFGGGNSDTPSAAARKPQGDGDRDRPDPSRFPQAVLPDGGFPGVILWPEVKPYATLIAPVPQRADGLGTVEVRPMSIPFSGEYWMFRWPFARPPKASYFQRGSPANLSFRTTDRRSLQMEAHHKLEQAIALDCCRSIQLAVRNADRYPNTIELELVLIDNERAGEPSLSLGREPVLSLPDLSRSPIAPVNEILTFPVPAAASISAFDEFEVVFVRDRRRADQSAKVAIERFILVPRL